MYCSKCGKQISEDSSFCTYCGNPLKEVTAPAQTVDFQTQKNDIRQSELNVLADAYNYFNKKKSIYNEYDSVCDSLNYYSRGAKSGLIIWGCIIFSITTLILFILAAAESFEAFPYLLITGMFPSILMIIGGILMKINNAKKMTYYKNEYSRLVVDLYRYYLQYKNCPFGPEYSNPNSIKRISSILQSGRADTVKDSLNLMLNDINMRRLNSYNELTERNTREINISIGVHVIFAPSKFF